MQFSVQSIHHAAHALITSCERYTGWRLAQGLTRDFAGGRNSNSGKPEQVLSDNSPKQNVVSGVFTEHPGCDQASMQAGLIWYTYCELGTPDPFSYVIESKRITNHILSISLVFNNFYF